MHENIAAVDLAGGLARQEPSLAGQILWGARVLVAVDGLWARHVMDAWDDDRCSLRYAITPAERVASGPRLHSVR